MRRTWLIAALLGLAACNANPLLTEASSNYSPLKVGDTWAYEALPAQAGNPWGFSTLVYSYGTYQGRQAYNVSEFFNNHNLVSGYWWSFDGGDWLQWDTTLNRWCLFRRLPYVTGNSWPIPSHQATDQINTIVDGTENLSLASGYYANCFKLRTVTQSYVGGVTTTTESDAWVAPGIGDVQYGQVDANGTASVTDALSTYRVH